MSELPRGGVLMTRSKATLSSGFHTSCKYARRSLTTYTQCEENDSWSSGFQNEFYNYPLSQNFYFNFLRNKRNNRSKLWSKCYPTFFWDAQIHCRYHGTMTYVPPKTLSSDLTLDNKYWTGACKQATLLGKPDTARE